MAFEYNGTDITTTWTTVGTKSGSCNYQLSGTDLRATYGSCSASLCTGTKTCASNTTEYEDSGTDISAQFMTTCTSSTGVSMSS